MSRRPALSILGAVLVALGLLWAAQGAGLVDWPSGSIMLRQRVWIWIGLAMAIVGGAALVAGRRR